MITPNPFHRPPPHQAIPHVSMSIVPGMIAVTRVMQWGLAGLALCACLVTGWMGWDSRTLNEAADRYTSAAERTEEMNRQFRAQLEHDQLTLSAQQIAAIQQEVRFINQLAEKRRFSWVQMLHDLEEALPVGIVIEKIERAAKDSTITIDGRAVGMQEVNAFMTTLQTRPAFRHPVLHHHHVIESHTIDRGGEKHAGVDFSISVQYREVSEKGQRHDVS